MSPLRRKECRLSEFEAYLRLGFGHIADLGAYDHILFVAALTATYPPSAWRRLVWLVTAFTVGHSITLGLATLGLVHASRWWVELLIPVTIVATSLTAIWTARDPAAGNAMARRSAWVQYTLASGFGLIHGLGFSAFLRSLLGAEESITVPLLAFNLGLEVGQVGIVLAVLALGWFVEHNLRVPRRDWVLILCGGTMGIALTMILERLRTPA